MLLAWKKPDSTREGKDPRVSEGSEQQGEPWAPTQGEEGNPARSALTGLRGAGGGQQGRLSPPAPSALPRAGSRRGS